MAYKNHTPGLPTVGPGFVIRREINVMEFQSPARLVDFWRTHARPLADFNGTDLADWYGENESQAVTRATLGHLDGYDAARALMERMTVKCPTSAVESVPTVGGGALIAAEWIAGEPECMRVPVENSNASNPLRIYVDNGTSASIPFADMVKRGSAIVALALRMAALRPVEVFVCDFGNGPQTTAHPGIGVAGVVTRINFDGETLGSAVYATCAIGYTRRFGYQTEAMWGASADGMMAGRGWPRVDGQMCLPTTTRYQKAMRQLLGIDGDRNALFIPGVFQGDYIVEHPEQWLQDRIDQFVNQMTD